MEDYREKIEKLPIERLQKLVSAYNETIRQLQERHKQAMLVAMLKDAEYSTSELIKKNEELAKIKQILEKRLQSESEQEKSG